MAISDFNIGGRIERQWVKVVTVDPRSRRIEGLLKDFGIIQISVTEIPVSFRWPVEGEYWMVIRENGEWYLRAPMQDGRDETKITVEQLDPGTLLLDSENIVDALGRPVLAGSVGADRITGVYSENIIGDITADQIGSVTAGVIDVGGNGLAAISSDLGIINAGTITDAIIQTAASGARVELSGITPTGLKKYDASGNVTVNIGQIDGLDLLAATDSSPPNDRRLRWIDSGSTVISDISTARYTSGPDTLTYLIQEVALGDGDSRKVSAALRTKDANSGQRAGFEVETTKYGTIFHKVMVDVGGALSTVLDTNGDSDFAQKPASARRTTYFLTAPVTLEGSFAPGQFVQYLTEIHIPWRTSVTGIQYQVGDTFDGNVIVALYDSAGDHLISSAAVAQTATAFAFQKVAFGSPYTVEYPGKYLLSIILSSATGELMGGQCQAPTKSIVQASHTTTTPITYPTGGGLSIQMSTY